jgi:hypothetical protein
MAKLARIEGCLTAIVTPLKGGKVDFDSLAKLVDWQIEQGVDGIVHFLAQLSKRFEVSTPIRIATEEIVRRVGCCDIFHTLRCADRIVCPKL